ncbi:MAG: helix-turn-helix transcriptional regulator [bacterium]|nr:helix-turn-helix transcriptional regulator [bacterium]
MSQSQLAEKAGIGVRVYQNYEQGVRDIEKAQLSVLLKICVALECEMSDIFMDENMIELVKKYHK